MSMLIVHAVATPAIFVCLCKQNIDKEFRFLPEFL